MVNTNNNNNNIATKIKTTHETKTTNIKIVNRHA